LPLALVLPDLEVLLIESVRKKARFLQVMVGELDLGARVRWRRNESRPWPRARTAPALSPS
jgi:16S rRNA G527 N7-methylase RsmG